MSYSFTLDDGAVVYPRDGKVVMPNGVAYNNPLFVHHQLEHAHTTYVHALSKALFNNILKSDVKFVEDGFGHNTLVIAYHNGQSVLLTREVQEFVFYCESTPPPEEP